MIIRKQQRRLMEGKEHEEYVKQQLIAALFKFRFDQQIEKINNVRAFPYIERTGLTKSKFLSRCQNSQFCGFAPRGKLVGECLPQTGSSIGTGRVIPTYRVRFPLYNFLYNLPLLLFLLLAVLGQLISTQLICTVILLISKWRKDYFQTLFLTLLLLAAPLVLAAMGITIMKWFSVWPLYGWTALQ